MVTPYFLILLLVAPVDFARQVEPILRSRCYPCPGPQQQMNGLRLDRPEDAIRGSHTGPVIRPGNSAESKLIHMVTVQKMPPVGAKLTAAEIALLRAWIDQGANWGSGAG